MRHLAAFAALVAAALSFAAAPPPPPETAADELNLLFLGTDRPVRIRLHLRHGDRPYTAAFDDWSEKLFKWHDRDGNGSLSPAEVGRLLEPNYFATLARGGIRGDVPQKGPSFASLDRNKDGRVSLAELRSVYLTIASLRPVTFSVNEQPAQNAARVNAVLWKLLDTDGDGKLSKEEVARLPGLMSKLDENEDELLTENEINPAGDSFSPFVRPAPSGGPPGTGILFAKEYGIGRVGMVASRLIAVYDRNKDGRLTRQEVGLDEKAFAVLDTDRNGKLDAKELEGVWKLPPDLTLKATVGPLPRVAGILDTLGLASRLGAQRLTLLSPTSGAAAKQVRRASPDAVELRFGDSRLEMTAVVGQSSLGGRFNRIKQFYLQQFDQITMDEKGKKRAFVTREEEKTNGNTFVFALFTAADRDGDDKLTRTELASFLDLIEGAQDAQVSLRGLDIGQSLFRALDGANASRLTMRDLRTGWKRIEPLCKEKKALARDDLPRRVQLTLGVGQFFNQPTAVFAAPVMTTGPFRGAAPPWFRKMDRNADGDLSPKEWLGTEEDFKKLDTDGDGLISAAEALKAGDPTKGK